MHEMALTRDVVDIVIAEAEKAHATSVRSVTLTIGYVRDIVEDIFEGLFDFMTKGTVAEGAELTIIRVPLMVQCNHCDAVYHIEVLDSNTWPCPQCSERDYTLKSGMEFRIDDINIISGRSDHA